MGWMGLAASGRPTAAQLAEHAAAPSNLDRLVRQRRDQRPKFAHKLLLL
jgi:hypothetical protein